MAGQYKCIVNPSDVQDSGSCTLYVKGQLGYHERKIVEDTNSGVTEFIALGVLSGIISAVFISILISGCYKGSTSWLTQVFHQCGCLVKLASLHTGSSSRSRKVNLGWAYALVLALIWVVPVQGVTAVCMASNVQEGENAKVSCHFDMDINFIKRDVLIYVYKNKERDPVFVLSWMGEIADVKVKSGYVFDGVISEYIVINIPNATHDKAGEYKCIVAPSIDADTRPCTLTIKGKKVDIESQDSITTISDTTTNLIFFTIFSTDSSDFRNLGETSKEWKMETNIITAIVLSSLLIATIAVFVTIIVVAWKKGLICTGKAGNNSNRNPNPVHQNHHKLQTIVPNGQNHHEFQTLVPNGQNHHELQTLVPNGQNHQELQILVPNGQNHQELQTLVLNASQ